MDVKDCPMCGEVMRLVARQRVEHVPGQSTPVTHGAREWICPECDYFEEADE